MAHKHILGIPDLVICKVAVTASKPTYDIVPGDLVYIVSGKIAPVTAFTWDTDLATTQAELVLVFAGMSAGRSRLGTTDTRDLDLPVLQDGTELCDVNSAAYTFGQYLGPKKASGNALLQTLVGVATKSLATHIAMETSVGSVTSLKARLINTAPKR